MIRLPLVGIEVEGLNRDVINRIFKLELYYPIALIPELIGVIVKEAKKVGLDRIPNEAIEGLNSIIYGDVVKLVLPQGEDVEIAYELIRKCHNDLFDALLGSSSISFLWTSPSKNSSKNTTTIT